MSQLLRSLCLSLLAASCASHETVPAFAPASTAPRSNELSARFPAAKTRLQIEAGDASGSLEQLLQRVSESTGLVFSYNESTRSMLSTTRTALSARVAIEPAQLYPWVETLLVQHGFFLGSPTNAQPPVVQVAGRRSPAEGPLPLLDIDARDIAFCTEHPAVMVTTTLELPHMDVRTLGNSLRGITSDPSGSQGILPVANTDSIVLTGPGGSVANLVALLKRVDLAAANGVNQRDAIAAEAAKVTK